MQRLLLSAIVALSALGCTAWTDPSSDEDGLDEQLDGEPDQTAAPPWNPAAFAPRPVEPPRAADAWRWPAAASFRQRFDRYDAAARPLGLVDATIRCEQLWDERRCHDDGPPGSPPRLLLAAASWEGELLLQAIDADRAGLCRGTCAVRDAHYEVAYGDPRSSPTADVLEDGRLLELDIHSPAPAPRPGASRWGDWVYAQTLVAQADCTGNHCFDRGDEAGYLAGRLLEGAQQLDDPEDRRDAVSPPIPPSRLAGGPVDLVRFFVGLTLRFDTWLEEGGASRRHGSLPWQGHGGFAAWRRNGHSPPPDVLGWAIADAGMSAAMAVRLRDLMGDPQLDGYNRVRAAAVLMGLLGVDPELAGVPSTRLRRGIALFEPFLLEATEMVARVEEDWTAPVLAAGWRPDEEEAAALRATLSWLGPDPVE